MTAAPLPETLPPICRPRAARRATFLTFFANGLGFGAWAGAIPPVKAALSLSAEGLSIALLSAAVGAVVMMQLSGRLIPRLRGTGRATRLASLANAAILSTPVLAPGLGWLCVATTSMGAFGGLMAVAMNAHAATVEKQWGTPIMSSFHAGFSVGGLIGAATVAVLLTLHVPLPWLLAPVSLLLLALNLAIAASLGEGDRAAGESGPLRLPERRLLPFALIALFCFLIEGGMADWSGLYLIAIGASPATATTGFAAFSLTMVIGRFLGDAMVHRFGGGAVTAYGALVAACGLTLACSISHPAIAATGFALVGIGLSNVVPTVFGAAARLSPTPAAGIAVASTAGYAGMLTGPPVIGAIAGQWGLRIGIAAMALAALTAVVAAVVAQRNGSHRAISHAEKRTD